MLPRHVDVAQVLFLLLIQLPEHALGQHLGEPDDGIQRCPQFVGHVRQELRLMLAGNLQLAALIRDLLKEPGILDSEERLGRECL